MIPLKKSAEIEIMAQSGRRLADVMKVVLAEVKPGVRLNELEKLAETLIKEKEAEPSFKMVEGYQWATCINLNSGVVHGVPTEKMIQSGDLVSVDMGLFYQGFHSDMARTVVAGKSSVPKKRFLASGWRTLRKAVSLAKPGNRVGHLSMAIERGLEQDGFSPVETLVGHGIGRQLHEAPQIPGFLQTKVAQTALLKPGMVLAIEVIYAQENPEVVIDQDGWTVRTEDGSLAAVFEDTIAVTKRGPRILTPLANF